MRLKALLFAIIGVLSVGTARADVTPHPIFSDNMVLQQGVDVVVWGLAAPGEEVQVALERKTANEGSAVGISTKAEKDGKWSVTLPKQKAGTGYKLTVKGKNTVEFKNVAVGEVWICSGQSNMEWSVNAGETPDKIKEGATNPNLRLFTVKKRTAATPIDDQTDLKHFTTWVESSPDTVGGFSAVAYHFGQKLQKELDVPVGLIHTSWGGTPAQAWTSLEALDAEPSLKYYADAARTALKVFESDKKAPSQNSPSALFNAMIHPLLNFKVRGAIWYQGESNTGKAYEYRTLFPAMIVDWRKRFACELPFMLVQLAPYGNGKGNSGGVTYAELRDAQLHTTKKLPKVGMAVITDVGNETDIHPKPKQPVGERLALAALAIEYGKKIAYTGPVFKDVKLDGATATLTFEATGKLAAKDGELAGFTVAGEDLVFVPAKATIKGNTVTVSSDKVQKIAAVRYGWQNFASPTLNLTDEGGLPASPFRTDDTPYTTQPKPKK
jgi:sialate O-acetylesterase